MPARTGRGEGWSLVGWAAILIAAESALTLLLAGSGEAGLRMAIRVTARSSVALFLLAFAASSVNTLFRGRAGRWLLRNRRYLGLGFAVSHAAHAAFVIALAVQHPASFFAAVKTSTLVGGSVGYLFVLAMVVTSFDGPTRAIGRRAWKILHKSGSYVLWAIFLFSYLGAVIREPSPLAAALLSALAAAQALRVAAFVRRRARRAPRPA